MNRLGYVALAFSLLAPLTLFARNAHAFCGVIEETGEAKDVKKATKRAERAVLAKMKVLRKQHGSKLVVDEMFKDCLAADSAYNKSGKFKDMRATCVASQSYCVNP